MQTIIFFTLTLFGLILSNPTMTSAQTPPPRRVPTSSTVAKPPPTSAGLKVFPDLQVTEMKYDQAKCTMHVRVANSGLGDSGAFFVWLNFVGAPIKAKVQNPGLAGKRDAWLKYTAWNPWLGNGLPKCLLENMTRTQAVADARFLYFPENSFLLSPTGDRIQPGDSIPVGMIVAEPQVQESNENNNQLVLKKTDMKPWP